MKKFFVIIIVAIAMMGAFVALIMSGQTDHIKESVRDAYASVSGFNDVVYKGHTDQGYRVTVTRLSDDDFLLEMTMPEEVKDEGSDGVTFWGIEYSIHVDRWDSEMESRVHTQSRNEALGSVIFDVYIGGAIVLACLAFLLALIF